MGSCFNLLVFDFLLQCIKNQISRNKKQRKHEVQTPNDIHHDLSFENCDFFFSYDLVLVSSYWFFSSFYSTKAQWPNT